MLSRTVCVRSLYQTGSEEKLSSEESFIYQYYSVKPIYV